MKATPETHKVRRESNAKGRLAQTGGISCQHAHASAECSKCSVTVQVSLSLFAASVVHTSFILQTSKYSARRLEFA